MYHYKAKILEWLDADSCRISCDLGFFVSIEMTVRVNGINTPEVRGVEKPRGLAALAHATYLAPPGGFVEVRSEKPAGGDKFGRFLASIQLRDGRDYAAAMITEGHAMPWDGHGKKPV